MNGGTFNQQGGMVAGNLENYGTFNYSSGDFQGRLLNYGIANLFVDGNTSFTAGDGLLHASTTSLDILAGQSLTLNGQGLTNEATMTLAGTLWASQEIIGDAGTGSFTQTGGTNTVPSGGALTLANLPGSSGTYNLQGGSLTADTVNLHDGGVFSQTGGFFSFNTFNQAGGTLSPHPHRRRHRHRQLHPERRHHYGGLLVSVGNFATGSGA